MDLEMTSIPEINEAIANPTVRKAIRYALDYENYLPLAGPGTKRVCGVIPEVSLGALLPIEEECINRDLDMAKGLLAEAGYPDGFDVEFTYESTGVWHGLSFQAMAEKVQADLGEVGINVVLDPQEGNVGYKKLREGKTEFFLNIWLAYYTDGGAQLGYFCPGTSLAMRFDWSADKAPDIDAACKAAVAIGDPEKRAEAYREVQRMFLEDSVWVSFLNFANQTGVRSNVKNLAFHPNFVVQLKGIDIEQ
jgi:peptide/nickel transport system substrate-binding protein